MKQQRERMRGEVEPEGYGLCPLEMGVAGHHGVEMRGGPIDQHVRQIESRISQDRRALLAP
jgi:hypothetical protein